MLSFDVRSLEAQAAVVNDVLNSDDPIWQPGDPLPKDGARVTGRLSSAGSGRFYWHGKVEGDVSLTCRRCLNDATAHVRDETHLIFAQEGEETDDPDVYRLDPNARELDLRPALREQWLLAAPGFGLCRDECRGLCPRCGADLNADPCRCEPRAG
jgi:uncharacterized protein